MSHQYALHAPKSDPRLLRANNINNNANKKEPLKKPKKTVYVLRRNSGAGGAEKAAERIACQLEPYFDVRRLWAGEEINGEKIPGLKGPPWWRSWRYTQFIDNLRLKKRGLVISLEYGPDCHIYRAGDGIHRLNVKRRYGRNPLWMINPWHWYASMQERKCMESAKVIVANSNLVKQLITKEYPQLANKVQRIYNGFDSQIYNFKNHHQKTIRETLKLPPDGKILLFAGHGFKRKGLHHAIRLLSTLRHTFSENAHLVVAGKGNARYVKDMIKHAKLEEYIHFHGSVKKLSNYFHAADAMILPTRHDPFSNACLEALACGCPVITSSQNGAAEVIQPQTGYIFADYSTQSFQSAAKFIMNTDTPRREVAATVEQLEQKNELSAYLTLIQKLGVVI